MYERAKEVNGIIKYETQGLDIFKEEANLSSFGICVTSRIKMVLSVSHHCG